jgi:hypothetical protein
VVLPDHLRQGNPGISKTPEHDPVRPEHLFLLFMGRAIGPVLLRLHDGAPDVRWERVLRVIPQVEPPPVPAVVRAGQRR